MNILFEIVLRDRAVVSLSNLSVFEYSNTSVAQLFGEYNSNYPSIRMLFEYLSIRMLFEYLSIRILCEYLSIRILFE